MKLINLLLLLLLPVNILAGGSNSCQSYRYNCYDASGNLSRYESCTRSSDEGFCNPGLMSKSQYDVFDAKSRGIRSSVENELRMIEKLERLVKEKNLLIEAQETRTTRLVKEKNLLIESQDTETKKLKKEKELLIRGQNNQSKKFRLRIEVLTEEIANLRSEVVTGAILDCRASNSSNIMSEIENTEFLLNIDCKEKTLNVNFSKSCKITDYDTKEGKISKSDLLNINLTSCAKHGEISYSDIMQQVARNNSQDQKNTNSATK